MIDEARIMEQLDALLSTSEPGATLHHLHVLAAPAGAVGPLGVPDPEAVAFSVYVIAPTGPVDVDRFIMQTILAAAVQAERDGVVVLFAGLSFEAWVVRDLDELGQRLQREGRLGEHPDAAEVTVVYGVCRDGRRWTGRRWLTGPQAGTAEDVVLLVGRPAPGEGGMFGRLVRVLAGLGG